MEQRDAKTCEIKRLLDGNTVSLTKYVEEIEKKALEGRANREAEAKQENKQIMDLRDNYLRIIYLMDDQIAGDDSTSDDETDMRKKKKSQTMKSDNHQNVTE